MDIKVVNLKIDLHNEHSVLILKAYIFKKVKRL